MRDEMFSRDWVDNHEAFSADLDRGVRALGVRLRRFLAWDGTISHLAVLILSAAITTLTFNGTAA
jgi:hypothetical protein